MRAPLLSAAVLLVIGLSTAGELVTWIGEARSRVHAAPVLDLSRHPLDAETVAAVRRSLGEQAPHIQLALDHVAAGDDLLVLKLDGAPRDAFKQARVLSIALRSLLAPSQVAALRDLPTARPAVAAESVLWLLQLDRSSTTELEALGLQVVEERAGGRIWTLGAGT
jgi:hypothetical protein